MAHEMNQPTSSIPPPPPLPPSSHTLNVSSLCHTSSLPPSPQSKLEAAHKDLKERMKELRESGRGVEGDEKVDDYDGPRLWIEISHADVHVGNAIANGMLYLWEDV